MTKEESGRVVAQIAAQREQMQEDVCCILDGIDDDLIVDRICGMIVERCNLIVDSVNKEEQ